MELRGWARPSNFNGLSVVETLYFGKDLLIPFYEISKFVEKARPLEACDILSPGRVKGSACSSYSHIDVLFGSCRQFKGHTCGRKPSRIPAKTEQMMASVAGLITLSYQ